MNSVRGAPAHKAETVDLRHDDVGVDREANRISLERYRSTPRWLWATARTIDARRDDLARAHWKKIWRSVHDD